MKKLMKVAAVVGMVAMGICLTGCQKAEDTSSAEGTASAATPYPLQVCIVSGEALGSMGDPVVMVHAGQEIKFCCKDCVKEFESDPAKYLAKLAADAKVPELPKP